MICICISENYYINYIEMFISSYYAFCLLIPVHLLQIWKFFGSKGATNRLIITERLLSNLFSFDLIKELIIK